jgi:hypothetical protein
MPGIPRSLDGKPNLSAPAPRTTDGTPDITELWKPGPGYVANIAKDLKPGDVPYQLWFLKTPSKLKSLDLSA